MDKKKLVILSGAGISKESGIDTFRDKDGLWKKHDALKLASIEGWNENPLAVLDFYNARRRQLLDVQPNKAHELLAELEEWYDVSIITQNVVLLMSYIFMENWQRSGHPSTKRRQTA